jgi:hypothetical protein
MFTRDLANVLTKHLVHAKQLEYSKKQDREDVLKDVLSKTSRINSNDTCYKK